MSGSVAVVAEMTVRSLVRRRASMAILLALPLLFYVARHDHVGQSIRSLLFGVSWAVTTVAFFATMEVRDVEPRLCLSGWSWRGIVGGRVAGLLGVGWALSVAYLVLVFVTQPTQGRVGLAIDFLVTGAVSVAVGSFLGAIVHRELEGALLIFLLAGLQSVVNPDSALAHVLPFWSSREIGTFAIDGTDKASLVAGLLHALMVLVGCGSATLLLSHRRLRPRAARALAPSAGRR